MAKESTEKRYFDVVFLCRNTVFCFLATGLLLLAGAVAAVYLSMQDSMVELLVMVLTAVCVLIGGYRAGKHAGVQGLLRGGLFGFVYMACLTLAGMLVYGEWSMDGSSWISILIGIFCGAIGGMLGVNANPKSKRKR